MTPTPDPKPSLTVEQVEEIRSAGRMRITNWDIDALCDHALADITRSGTQEAVALLPEPITLLNAAYALECPDMVTQEKKNAIAKRLMDKAVEIRAHLSQPAQGEAEVCCGKYATCERACTPRGRWLAYNDQRSEAATTAESRQGVSAPERMYSPLSEAQSSDHPPAAPLSDVAAQDDEGLARDDLLTAANICEYQGLTALSARLRATGGKDG